MVKLGSWAETDVCPLYTRVSLELEIFQCEEIRPSRVKPNDDMREDGGDAGSPQARKSIKREKKREKKKRKEIEKKRWGRKKKGRFKRLTLMNWN